MEECLERPKPKQKKKKKEAIATESNSQNLSVELNINLPEKSEDLHEINQKHQNADTKKNVIAQDEQAVCESEVEIQDNDKININPLPEETCSSNVIVNSDHIDKTAAQDDQNVLSFDRIMMKNKQLIKTAEQINKFYDEYNLKQGVKNNPPLIKCMNEVKLKPENIRPYTEAQLLALYSNSEIETLQQFLFAFVEYELKGVHIRQHPLYDLLEQYLQNKNKITGNNLELEQARQEYFEIQNQLWSLNSSVVKEQGTCQDGIVVSATHTYNKAVFHRSSFHTMNCVLTKIRHLSTECHVLHSYSANINKLQVELFIQNLRTNCLNLTQITKDSPVTLSLKDVAPEIIPQLQELKICISILFQFQRRLIRDVDFIKETRMWLQDLVAILLRVANYQDHLFLLSHLLRCPPGVGTWASAFVQTPLPSNKSDSPFSSFEINHIMTILALLLMPIDKRDQFLEELIHHRENPGETPWVMVDSDGEEDEESLGLSLRENDLVALFNQLPIDDVFRMLLKIQRKDGQDYFDGSQITEHHILRLFAFSTMILRILQSGLQTYAQNRYNQFAKRLCRMVRHIVQYATDIWDYFKTNQSLNDSAMLERLQVEYDAFFLRAIYCLYNSKKMGAWQFLAVVPYNLISRRCLWKIFYFLHDPDSSVKTILDPIDNTDYSEKLWNANIRLQFEEKLNLLEDSESYYLLNTFANMALSRESEDMDFIEAATHDLLQIGFISETTQENCCKNARILLTHMTSKYISLFSHILKIVESNINKIGSLSLYLYEELPIFIWKPDESDIIIITKLLKTNPINHDGSKLARMIISRLNWDLSGESLFIPYTYHCKIALLVAEIVQEELGYSQWGWQTLFRLRLHYTDKGLTDFSKVHEPERFDILRRGIKNQNLIACFVSLLMTTWGHLVPVICSKGFDHIILLQINQKHEAALFILNLIIPLFLNSQETLVNCEKFQNIVSAALNAERGYLHLAKSLIGVQNLVMQQFGHLIENHILNHRYYGAESARYIVRIWINTLVSVPNWNKDFGVMYLLDVIIKSSFLDSDALSCCVTSIKDLLQSLSPQDQTSTISSLFKWVAPSPGTLLINSSLGSYPWLAYLIIDLEFEEKERQTGLWREVLSQLESQKGRINVDAAIKKAASFLKVPSFTSSSLCLFRWAQQALDTNIGHPLSPLMWQKFFNLYLYRLPVSGCIGEKFFEGVINFQFQKRLKRHLQDCVSYYQKMTEKSKAENSEQKMFFESCLGIFKAYSLWLEEPTLQESTLYLPSLPPEYKPNYLSLIFQGNTSSWMEFVNTFIIHSEQQKALKSWRSANYREKSNVNQPLPHPGNRNESDDPCERILMRLKTYDAPKEPPVINVSTSILPVFNLDSKDEMFGSLDNVFKTISKFAREHNLSCSEYKTLDCMYQELVPQLYISVINKVNKQITCSGPNKSSHCSGAAVITLQAKEARMNEGTRHQIDNNRRNYDTLLKKIMLPPSQHVCISAVTLLQAISELRSKLSLDPSTLEIGVELFYFILSLMNEEINNYLPGKQLYSQCLEVLGQSHIHGREFEHPRLLNNILEKPELRIYLLQHFLPVNSGTANFILMYSTICEKILDKYDVAFALLSKFDVNFWLKTKNPKLTQRSKFINVLIAALQTLGFEPPPDSACLHSLLRKHLICMLDHQFPEHFGEILIILLKASNCGMDTGFISVSIWLDFLNYLSKPVEINLALPLRDQIRLYAQKQRLLRNSELLETATLLSKHFTQERFQYGLYGLYPKTRNYTDAFMAFNGMIGHALVISTLNMHPGVLGDSLCEIIWPYLRDMFSPWVMPYWMQNMKESMANWIKQLTDDRAVILPWIPSDGPFAVKSVHMFLECIMFVVQTLPASGKILSFVWHWYVTNFAHSAVKDHILNVIHSQFSALPWQNFWPSIADLDLMLKVIEQYLPDCHVFLGHIFMSVNWPVWLANLVDVTPIQVRARILHSILILLVKLSNEPKIRASHIEKAKSLLVQAECFDWSLIDQEMYHHIMDWYVMSCDPSVVFKLDPLDLDFRILSFLSAVAHYTKTTQLTSDSFQKRHIYIRSYVKLVAVFTSRNKAQIASKEKDLQHLIANQLNYLERYKNQEELNILFETFLEILNNANISAIALKSFDEYITNKSKDAILINAVLNGIGKTVCDKEVAACLYEITILSYFANEVVQSKMISWKNVTTVITFNVLKHSDLENVLIKKGSILTLHAYVMQKIEKALDYKHLISNCLEWLRNVKISEEIEPKIPLIWVDVLTMALDYCEIDEACSGMLLHKFAQTLINCADETEGSKWGRSILGAIGIIKPTISIQFKFLCKAVAAYVLAQLPEMKGNPQTVRRVVNGVGSVGQPGGNVECPKVLLKLDFGYTQGKIKDCAEIALKEIQNPANSLHNILSFLNMLLNQFYIKSYLRDIS